MSSEDNYFIYDNIDNTNMNIDNTNMNIDNTNMNIDNIIKIRDKHSKNIQTNFFIQRITELLTVAEGNGLSSKEILRNVINNYKGANFKIQILSNISNSSIIQRRLKHNIRNSTRISLV